MIPDTNFFPSKQFIFTPKPNERTTPTILKIAMSSNSTPKFRQLPINNSNISILSSLDITLSQFFQHFNIPPQRINIQNTSNQNRLSPSHDRVVTNHRQQIKSNTIMPIHPLRNFNLRPDPIKPYRHKTSFRQIRNINTSNPTKIIKRNYHLTNIPIPILPSLLSGLIQNLRSLVSSLNINSRTRLIQTLFNIPTSFIRTNFNSPHIPRRHSIVLNIIIINISPPRIELGHIGLQPTALPLSYRENTHQTPNRFINF